MNFGTQQIQDIIFNQAKRAGLKGYPLGKYAKDTAKEIWKLIEGSDMNRDWNIIHNFPEHLEPLVRRLESGLKFNLFPRTEQSAEIYQWILEQEKQGYKLETFISWALSPERVQYAGKYRSKPEYLMADYPQAFVGQPQVDNDGSLKW